MQFTDEQFKKDSEQLIDYMEFGYKASKEVFKVEVDRLYI